MHVARALARREMRIALRHPDRRVTEQRLHDPKRRAARRQDRRERVPKLVPLDPPQAALPLRRVRRQIGRVRPQAPPRSRRRPAPRACARSARACAPPHELQRLVGSAKGGRCGQCVTSGNELTHPILIEAPSLAARRSDRYRFRATRFGVRGALKTGALTVIQRFNPAVDLSVAVQRVFIRAFQNRFVATAPLHPVTNQSGPT